MILVQLGILADLCHPKELLCDGEDDVLDEELAVVDHMLHPCADALIKDNSNYFHVLSTKTIH